VFGEFPENAVARYNPANTACYQKTPPRSFWGAPQARDRLAANHVSTGGANDKYHFRPAYRSETGI